MPNDDLIDSMTTAGIRALVASRPGLTVEELLTGIVRAASSMSMSATPATQQTRPMPEGAAREPREPRKRQMADHKGRPGKKVSARKVVKAAPRPKLRPVPLPRKPGRVAVRSPLAKRAARAKRNLPRLQLAPPKPPKVYRNKSDLVAALDHAVDGMLEKHWLPALEDGGSTHLAALSRAAGRIKRWAFKSWREALGWVGRDYDWEKVDPTRLATWSEHARAALEATAGGKSELDRRGICFADLPLPMETERWIVYRKWMEEGGDAFVSSGR